MTTATPPDIAALVKGLTKAQRSTILALDEHPSQLGCIEPYAKRLAQEKPRRPALVISEKLGTVPWPFYRLNKIGLSVQSALRAAKENQDA